MKKIWLSIVILSLNLIISAFAQEEVIIRSKDCEYTLTPAGASREDMYTIFLTTLDETGIAVIDIPSRFVPLEDGFFLKYKYDRETVKISYNNGRLIQTKTWWYFNGFHSWRTTIDVNPELDKPTFGKNVKKLNIFEKSSFTCHFK